MPISGFRIPIFSIPFSKFHKEKQAETMRATLDAFCLFFQVIISQKKSQCAAEYEISKSEEKKEKNSCVRNRKPYQTPHCCARDALKTAVSRYKMEIVTRHAQTITTIKNQILGNSPKNGRHPEFPTKRGRGRA
jgi:hypothetical protein